jgi:hypothetical protein
MTRAALLAALLFAAGGCIMEEGPMMEPGSDCMECHDGGEAPRWTVAGTWERQGQRVGIVDANGKSFTLHTNKAGNFWSSEPVAFPLTVSVDGVSMATNPKGGLVQSSSRGSCNRCHDHGGGGND